MHVRIYNFFATILSAPGVRGALRAHEGKSNDRINSITRSPAAPFRAKKAVSLVPTDTTLYTLECNVHTRTSFFCPRQYGLADLAAGAKPPSPRFCPGTARTAEFRGIGKRAKIRGRRKLVRKIKRKQAKWN